MAHLELCAEGVGVRTLESLVVRLEQRAAIPLAAAPAPAAGAPAGVGKQLPMDELERLVQRAEKLK